MEILLKTHDPVLVSAVTAFLKAEGIEAFVFDVHMSMIGYGMLPQRVMVREEDAGRARMILRMADIEPSPETDPVL